MFMSCTLVTIQETTVPSSALASCGTQMYVLYARFTHQSMSNPDHR